MLEDVKEVYLDTSVGLIFCTYPVSLFPDVRFDPQNKRHRDINNRVINLKSLRTPFGQKMAILKAMTFIKVCVYACRI